MAQERETVVPLHERLDLREFAVPEPDPEPTEAPSQQLREAKRDRALAQIASLLLSSARALDPLVGLISARLLHWVALGVAAGLAFQALRNPTWERLAVVACFMILCPWMLKGAK